jgi:hypothetical protein
LHEEGDGKGKLHDTDEQQEIAHGFRHFNILLLTDRTRAWRAVWGQATTVLSMPDS